MEGMEVFKKNQWYKEVGQVYYLDSHYHKEWVYMSILWVVFQHLKYQM